MKTGTSSRTRKFRLVIVAIAILVAVSGVAAYELAGMQKSAPVITGTVPVGAGIYNATAFDTPNAANIHIVGSFSAKLASGSNIGAAGKIEVIVVNDTYYQSFISGGSRPPSSFYDSGNIASGSFDVKLPATTPCWIVYWNIPNSYSMIVTSTVNVLYS